MQAGWAGCEAASAAATSTSSWTGAYANLTSDPLVAGAKGFNCEKNRAATETAYAVPLFNYVQNLGESDVHWARVRAMAGFTAAPNLTESLTTPETVYSYGLYSYGLYSYGLHSYGLYIYGLYIHEYGLYSYGLHSYSPL